MSYAKSVRTSAVAKHRGAAGQRSASSVNFPLSTAHRPGVSNHPSPSVFHEDHSAAPVQVYVRVRPPEQPAMSMTNVHVNVMAQKVSRQGFTIASYRDSVSPELANSWTNVTDEDGMVREEDHRTWRWTSHSVLYQGDTIGTYEAVLPPESDSKKVYAQVGEPVVHRLLDGYDGCIYAFGQTNSGKTYTVHGTPAEPGIVLRAAHQIFEFIAKTDGVMSMLRVSFLELYNETIRDLLTASPSAESGSAVEDTAALPWTQGGTLGAGQIVNDPDRGVIVAGLTERHVTCLEDVLEAIRDGESRRIIASNYAHEHASRSHTVFQLIFESRNVNQKQVRVSTLHIVDMAGSEASSNMLYEPPISPEPATTTRSRSAMYVPVPVEEPESIAERVSKVHEKRKKEIALRNAEGATIRRSLLALVRCVEVLSQSTAHSYVPYRDSKLTRLLCGTLGGTTYTAVICTVNPAEVKETFKTLRFGNLAQRIVNYPRKVNYLSSQALLIRYDEEVERMRQEVEDMENVRLQEEETMKRNLDSRNEQAKEALAQSLSAREAAMKRLQALQKFVLTSNSQNGEGRRQLQSDLLSVKRAGRTHPRDQHRAYATRAHSFSTLRDTVHHEMADKAWDALSKAMQRETEAMQKLRELRAQRRGIGHPTSQSSGRGANLTLEDLSLEQLREVVKRAQARAKQPDSKTASKVRQDPEEHPIERAKVFTEEDRNRLRMKVAHLRETTLQTATEYEAQKAALVVWNREIQKSSGCFGSSTNTPVDVQAHKKSQQDILKMKAYEILRKE